MRDLFEHDDGGWLQDVPLLDRLVTEKLKAEAETIAAEGWPPLVGTYPRLNCRSTLKERDQLLENLHPMPIDLPSQSIIEAWRMGMNSIPIG
jgi:hypothetical protein